MKNRIILILVAAALALASCSKDLTEAAEGPVVDKGATFTLSGQRPAVEPVGTSRVSISGDAMTWSAGDSLGVFLANSVRPVKFTLTEGAGTSAGKFSGALDAAADATAYVLYPYVPDTVDVVPTAAKITFNGQMQDGFGAKAEAHLGRYAYMASAPVSFSEKNGTLAMKNLAVKMSFEFSLPEAATVRFLTLSTDDAILYDKGVVDLTAAEPAAAPWGTASRTLSMGFRNGAVAAGETVTAHMMMLPADLSSKAVTFYISAEKADGTPVTYTMKKNAGLRFEASSSYTAAVDGLTVFDTHIPMVYVPGGSLNICAIGVEGKDDYGLLDSDYKVNSFWIARTEVTNAQYCEFLNARKPGDTQLSAWIAYELNESWQYEAAEAMQIERVDGTWRPKSGPILNADGTQTVGSYADYPMIYVTYLGANAYSFYLAEKWCGYPESSGLGTFLPSEAQWEYAATGSEWNPDWLNFWSGSNDPLEVAWHNANCDTEGSSCLGMYMGNGDDPNTMSPTGSKTGGTHPVAKLKANFLGIYDMSGNVSEICRDWFVYASFPYGPDSLDPWCASESAADKFQSESCRSCRGGLWSTFSTTSLTFYRDFITPTYYSNGLGFRPILTLK